MSNVFKDAGEAGMPLLRVRGLTKVYHLGEEFWALRGVDFDLHDGEFTSIIGQSGSGKSTLLNILGCLDRPTGGDYWLGGHHINNMSSDELAAVRNQILGFVFQSFHLLPRLTALENVMLPLGYDHLQKHPDMREAAVDALQRVGLGSKLQNKPTQMSGGQQQRVAVARALVNKPSLLMADEPTGNLDSSTAKEILGLFKELNSQGTTVVIITHDPQIAANTNRKIEISDGRIVGDTRIAQPGVAA
ncbi:MAG: ABC transporter ATP-binding protein [Steroidobacteraceae bacterium]